MIEIRPIAIRAQDQVVYLFGISNRSLNVAAI
jgi:hypothetical protein